MSAVWWMHRVMVCEMCKDRGPLEWAGAPVQGRGNRNWAQKSREISCREGWPSGLTEYVRSRCFRKDNEYTSQTLPLLVAVLQDGGASLVYNGLRKVYIEGLESAHLVLQLQRDVMRLSDSHLGG